MIMNEDAVIRPTEGHDYYSADYLLWNAFDAVMEQEARSISGRPDVGWIGHVLGSYGRQERALFVSCGNGWVERSCYEHGLISEAYGFDIMPDHIAAAEEGAVQIGMPAHYRLADGNNLDLPWTGFDMIVNNGSIHHIAHIDQLMRKLRTALKPDGIYVIMDYTGSHRNQYPVNAWLRAIDVNATLPARFQKRLRYPHMPTILALDPTEAIQAELQMSVTRRYFDIKQEVRFGGGVAYEILNFNHALHAEQHTREGQDAIAAILAADAELLKEAPETNLFTFAVCCPKPILPGQSVLDLWSAEESDREAAALRNDARYYPATPLELIYNELADCEYKLKIIQG
jgi:SAM-dependent methyltransferase